MKKNKILLSSLLLLSGLLSACGSQDAGVSFIGENQTNISTSIDETIDFHEYFDIPDGTSVSMVITSPSGEKTTSSSLYFLVDEIGDYTFEIAFKRGNASNNFTLTFVALPPAPDVTPATSSVNVNVGTTLSFDAIFNRSGIIALPLSYLDIDFLSVSYAKEVISVDNPSVEEIITTFDNDDTSFTFDKIGNYTFNLDIHNAAGSVKTTIEASANDESATFFGDGIEAEGAIAGEKEGCVKLTSPASISSLSYLGYEDDLSLAQNTFYTVHTRFRGKEAPQVMMLASSCDGQTNNGTGLIVTLEQNTPYDGMRIYGPNRLTSSSPLGYRARSIGRDNLKTDSVYDWKIVFTKLSETSLAVRSYLYEESDDTSSLAGFFDWLPLSYAGPMKGKTVFLGSSEKMNVTFEYEKPYLSDKTGQKATEVQQ